MTAVEVHEPFPHPETGVALETLPDFQDALIDVETRLGALYRVRTPIREELTRRFGPVLPVDRRNRTVAQAMVALCPRCGTKLTPREDTDES